LFHGANIAFHKNQKHQRTNAELREFCSCFRHDFTACEKLIGKGKKCQGTASQLAEKLIGKGKKCQGTTSQLAEKLPCVTTAEAL
jgi:hypothetical protein